ncbi:MAG: ATP-binding protein [Ginsengibacter sp.]
MPLHKGAHLQIQELKDALAYAEAIIDAIHEPLLVLHSDLRVRSANMAFYRTFKLTPQETIEKFIYELDHGQWNIESLKKYLQKTLLLKSPVKDFELAHSSKKAGEKFLCFNGRKLLLEGENGTMILLVIEDITPRKKYEAQLEKEKKIIAENLRLQYVSKQKDDFISMASHELKTPVTSIKAFAQLLEHDFARERNAQGVKMLTRMNAQIIKLTSLIEDLLDVSKIEGGKLQYHLADFDLYQMIHACVREMQLTTKMHKIKVDVHGSQIIYGDRDRIGQVLTNLLSNAIKYSPDSKDIIVSTTITKKFVCVHVRDFGIGISKQKQSMVFERFFRVTGVKEDTYPGLGLGLYISSEIIKRHKGKASVESVLGKGSVFSFRLPLKKSENTT